MRTFGDFYAHRGRIGSGDSRRPQHGILRENLAVNLGDKIVLPIRFAAPHLPELDGIHGHADFRLTAVTHCVNW